MTQQEFIQKVDADYKWYSKKSKLSRKYHISFKIFVIVISAVITILASLSFNGKDLTIAIMSSSIVIITGIYELMKYREKWLEYRTTAEHIKAEKIFFETNTDPYNNPATSFNLYVKNHDAILKSENEKWRGFVANKS